MTADNKNPSRYMVSYQYWGIDRCGNRTFTTLAEARAWAAVNLTDWKSHSFFRVKPQHGNSLLEDLQLIDSVTGEPTDDIEKSRLR